jgi:predicted nucleic acid-binding protein
MKKQWFVIRNEKHVGPYDLDSLSRMHQTGKVELDTFVWKEGWDNPKAYKDLLFELEGVPDLPPPIPLDSNLESTIEEDEILHSDTDSNTDLKDLEEVEYKNIEEDDQEFIEEEASQLKSKIIKIASGSLLVFVLISISTFYLLKKNNQASKPSQMKLSDFKALTSLIEINELSTKVEFYLSKNRSIIWMGSSNPYFGEIVLKVTSVYGRHLGDVEVEALSYGELKSNIATFDQVTFSKGEKIVEGYYNIEAYTNKPLQIPFTEKFSTQRDTMIKFKGVVYLGLLKSEKFEVALALKNKKEQTNEKKFWEELREKYLTIKMITIQIQNAMNDIFKENEKSWKEKVAIFENEYKAKYGDFFTSFVLANEINYSELEKKDFPDKLEVISNYARLSRIAKAIGTSTMDSLNMFESIDKGADLEDQVQNKFQGIIDLCDQKMEMINTTKL